MQSVDNVQYITHYARNSTEHRQRFEHQRLMGDYNRGKYTNAKKRKLQDEKNKSDVEIKSYLKCLSRSDVIRDGSDPSIQVPCVVLYL